MTHHFVTEDTEYPITKTWDEFISFLKKEGCNLVELNVSQGMHGKCQKNIFMDFENAVGACKHCMVMIIPDLDSMLTVQ